MEQIKENEPNMSEYLKFYCEVLQIAENNICCLFHLCRHWLLACLIWNIYFNIQQYYWSACIDTIIVWDLNWDGQWHHGFPPSG